MSGLSMIGRCESCALMGPLREVEFFGDGEVFRVCKECAESYEETP